MQKIKMLYEHGGFLSGKFAKRCQVFNWISVLLFLPLNQVIFRAVLQLFYFIRNSTYKRKKFYSASSLEADEKS